MVYLRFLAVVAVLFAHNALARADSLGELSDSFWQWRAVEQPFSDDDIPTYRTACRVGCRLVSENDRAADAAAQSLRAAVERSRSIASNLRA